MKKLYIALAFFIFTAFTASAALTKDEVLEKVNQTSDIELLRDIIEEYPSWFKLETGEGSLYFSFTGAGITKFYKNLVKSAPFASYDEAIKTVDYYLVLGSINDRKYPEIEVPLLRAEEDYDLDLSALYSLKGEYFEAALTEIGKYWSYESFTELQNKINSVCGELLKEQPPTEYILPDREDYGNYDRFILSDWAKEPFRTGLEKGLIPSGLDYDMTAPVSRENFCSFIFMTVVMKTGDAFESLEPVFEDSDNPVVTALYNLGIVNGVSKNRFNPDGLINREEAASIIYRTARYLEISGFYPDYRLSSFMFSDDEEISSWAKESVYQLELKRIVGGVGENRFAPKEYFTGEQAAAVMLRIYNL